MNKLLYYLLFGVFSSIMFRVGFKGNKIDPLWSILIMGCGMIIIGLILLVITKKITIFPNINSISYLLLSVFASCGGSVAIMLAMQNNINMNIFTPLQNVFTIIGVSIIGYVFWQEHLTIMQIIGIFFSLIGSYLLIYK